MLSKEESGGGIGWEYELAWSRTSQHAVAVRRMSHGDPLGCRTEDVVRGMGPNLIGRRSGLSTIEEWLHHATCSVVDMHKVSAGRVRRRFMLGRSVVLSMDKVLCSDKPPHCQVILKPGYASSSVLPAIRWDG